eukprot:TRINITY_DN1532_c0_g2_i3.p1 TRINITY_DN1532_c0_g2~~TRINITY_DN1532_c0_g2_i3.p1  ORF type:complete len:414 (-),score=74.34 TRINITY_DN1532_c0_g2_i3:16-1158(-)
MNNFLTNKFTKPIYGKNKLRKEDLNNSFLPNVDTTQAIPTADKKKNFSKSPGRRNRFLVPLHEAKIHCLNQKMFENSNAFEGKLAFKKEGKEDSIPINVNRFNNESFGNIMIKEEIMHGRQETVENITKFLDTRPQSNHGANRAKEAKDTRKDEISFDSKEDFGIDNTDKKIYHQETVIINPCDEKKPVEKRLTSNVRRTVIRDEMRGEVKSEKEDIDKLIQKKAEELAEKKIKAMKQEAEEKEALLLEKISEKSRRIEESLQKKIEELENCKKAVEFYRSSNESRKKKEEEANDIFEKVKERIETLNIEFKNEFDRASNILKEITKGFYEVANHLKETKKKKMDEFVKRKNAMTEKLSLIHICRCRRYAVCRSRWSPYH